MTGIAGLAGLVAVFGPTALGALSGSVSPTSVRVGLVCVVAVSIFGTGAWSYRHAIRAFGTHTID